MTNHLFGDFRSLVLRCVTDPTLIGRVIYALAIDLPRLPHYHQYAVDVLSRVDVGTANLGDVIEWTAARHYLPVWKALKHDVTWPQMVQLVAEFGASVVCGFLDAKGPHIGKTPLLSFWYDSAKVPKRGAHLNYSHRFVAWSFWVAPGESSGLGSQSNPWYASHLGLHDALDIRPAKEERRVNP